MNISFVYLHTQVTTYILMINKLIFFSVTRLGLEAKDV